MEILSLGEKIKLKRKECGFTLKDLAGDRISSGQISLIESGKSNPSMDLLSYISKTLGTSIDYLMENEDMQINNYVLSKENLFYYYLQIDDFYNAEIILNDFFEIGEKFHKDWLIASAYFMQGELLYKNGCYSDAIRNFLKSSKYFASLKNTLKISYSYYMIGEINFKLNKIKLSEHYLKKCEHINNNTEIIDPSFTCMINYYLFSIYLQENKLDEAEKYLDKASKNFDSILNKSDYATYLYKKSIDLIDEGKNEISLKYSTKARGILKEYNNYLNISFAKLNIGDFYIKKSQYENALKQYTDSFNIFNMTKDNHSIDSLLKLANLYITTGNSTLLKNTINILEKSIPKNDFKNMAYYYLLLFNSSKNLKDEDLNKFYLDNALQNALLLDDSILIDISLEVYKLKNSNLYLSDDFLTYLNKLSTFLENKLASMHVNIGGFFNE